MNLYPVSASQPLSSVTNNLLKSSVTENKAKKITTLNEMKPKDIVSAGTGYTPEKWNKLSVKQKNGTQNIRIETKNLKKISAIYYVVNTKTGRFYVGESGFLKNRIGGHNGAIKRNKQQKQQLYNDINTNSDNFRFGFTAVPHDKSPRKVEKKVVSSLKLKNKKLYNLINGGGGRKGKRTVKSQVRYGAISKASKDLTKIFNKMPPKAKKATLPR